MSTHLSTSEREKLQELLLEAVSCLENTPDFGVTGFENLQKYTMDTEVISRILKLHDSLSRLSSSNSFGVMKQAIVAIRNQSNVTVDNLIQEIENQISSVSSTPQSQYIFLFPINAGPTIVSLSSWSKRFNIDNHRVRWYPYKKFNRDFRTNIPRDAMTQIRMFTDWSMHQVSLTRFSFLEVFESGRDLEFAMNRAHNIVLKLLSILNWAKVVNKSSMTNLPARHAYSKILSPQGILCFDGNKRFLQFAPIDDFPTDIETLSADDNKRALWLYRKLNTLPAYSQSLLSDALLLYHHAVTDGTLDIAFLKFWMGLECITLNDKGVVQEQVLKRLKSVVKFKPAYFDRRFEMLQEKRNAFVHRGVFGNVSLDDLNFLKLVNEAMIFFLLANGNRIRSREDLEILYELGRKDSSQLKKWSSASSYLFKKRRAEETATAT